MDQIPRVSVIVPVGPRTAPDLAALYAEYRSGVQALGMEYEFVFVVDGPRPRAEPVLQKLLDSGEPVTIVSLTRPFGEATALMAGFDRSRGEIVITLPAYHQIDGRDIGKLVASLDSADVVIGYRAPRAGGMLERMRRNAFHALVGGVTGQRYQDLGCGARAMRRAVLAEVYLYGDQHRLFPVLAARRGFRVAEVAVRQSASDRFEGVYRPKEYAHRVLDIFSVFFLVRFTKKPLRFFGMVGVGTFGLGAAVLAVVVFQRLFLSMPLADRPALLLASLMIVLGLQLFALGLLGELIIFTHARDVKDYHVDRVIEFSAPTDSGSELLHDESRIG
jgi:glycosyltransferase involved in cell wall biosynthesis